MSLGLVSLICAINVAVELNSGAIKLYLDYVAEGNNMSCKPLLNMVMFYCRSVPFVVTVLFDSF